MIHYLPIPELQLPDKLQHQLEQLDWTNLTVTSEANRWQVFRRLVKWNTDWFDFLTFYGFFLGNVGTVKNLRIEAELEKSITEIIQSHFDCSEAPILRLQVMFGGKLLPLHTDITRHASLIFPIDNHDDARTNFYEPICKVDSALPNPVHCSCVETTVITVPTLINTDCIHAVVYDKPISQQRPRISLTAKWANTKFQDLV
jgi:hypothetical protein